MKIITVFLRKKLVNLLPTYIFFNEMDSYKRCQYPHFTVTLNTYTQCIFYPHYVVWYSSIQTFPKDKSKPKSPLD